MQGRSDILDTRRTVGIERKLYRVIAAIRVEFKQKDPRPGSLKSF
jgi:hypothetical protein